MKIKSFAVLLLYGKFLPLQIKKTNNLWKMKQE